jgi:wobble nucleotide-excising tRNase
MSREAKKIQTIKRMAVFRDFRWDASVRDAGNNIAEFKKINIIYGRNYSGKTTLSRIFRAMETGVLSPKYTNPEFNVLFDGGINVAQDALNVHGQTIRVFNEDFVRENLRFIVDDEHAINPFAILGEDNTKLEEEIARHESELGSEDKKTGLNGQYIEANDAFLKAKHEYDDKLSSLEGKLRDKANRSGSGIKHNKAFGDANYNVTKIKTDIKTVTADTFKSIAQDQVDRYQGLLKEEPKPTIPESAPLNLAYSTFASKAKELVEKKIKASDPIQDLLSDAALEMWVRTGRDHHRSKRNTCGFCGGVLPGDLWEKLDKHFNRESEQLRSEIDRLIVSAEAEKNRLPALIEFKASDYYSGFHAEIKHLREHYELCSQIYGQTLDELIGQLERRKNDIFSPLQFTKPNSKEHDLEGIREQYEELRNRSNEFTYSLSTEQAEARAALRLHEVHTFINDLKYEDECVAISKLEDEKNQAEHKKDQAQGAVNNKRELLHTLKAQLKDESKGADKVNDYLNNFFGHQLLSLRAIENTVDSSVSGYRFEVTRNDQKAYHLSEGECSLIAFCYFMAKLEDFETKGSQPIIWIDDPISSLDANHIFFVYSLINAEIVAPGKFKQLFVSTHNLDFMKYLKRLPGARNKNTSQYIIVHRYGQESILMLMPKHLKDYVTEFNFLFHQIYKCANAGIGSDSNHDCYYNFGNNARKFLEAFLYYKYPNAKEKDDKLSRFFGNDALASSLTDRINNEFSHLAGVIERSILPIDVPEMKTAAEFILRKIEENDPEQYEALLQSIGEEPEKSETEALAGVVQDFK